MRALWLVPAELKSERLRVGLCAACGEVPAVIPMTRRPRTPKGRRRRKRQIALTGRLHPRLLPILCGPCSAFNRAALCMKRPPPHKLVAFLRDGGRCVYCGRALLWSEGFARPGSAWHAWGVDHVVPRRHAMHGIENKAIACASCGSRKADRTPEEWVAASEHNLGRLPSLRAKAVPAAMHAAVSDERWQ